jgi:hypothetical protein
MAEASVPGWVSRLLAESGPPGELARDQATSHGEVVHGQLCYSSSPGQAVDHLLLVVDVDDVDRVVSAIMCSAELDLATDADVVIEPNESGLPYPVLAQADISVLLREAELGPRLGQVSADLLVALRDLRDGASPASLSGRRGLPLQGSDDVRWRRKENQAVAALALSLTALDLLEATAEDEDIAALAATTAAISGAIPRRSIERSAGGASVSVAPVDQGDGSYRLDLQVAAPSGPGRVAGLRLVVLEHGSLRRASAQLDRDGRGQVDGVRGPYSLRLVDAASPESLWEELAVAAASPTDQLLVHLESTTASVAVDVWDRGGEEISIDVVASADNDGLLLELPVVPADLLSVGFDHVLVPLSRAPGSERCVVRVSQPRSSILTRGGYIALRPATEVHEDELRRSLRTLPAAVGEHWRHWAASPLVPRPVGDLVDRVLSEER